ncbi:MAG: class I SAM-dependent methyltransferase [Anaerolineales bacterium]|nr:class I SAM-dependent methyltransferase [Anaerolineales bacterium]
MDDKLNLNPPPILERITTATKKLGFSMASDDLTGSLLRTLAVSKPAGTFLELGTGTGISTAWILNGMHDDSILYTIDNDEEVVAVARHFLGHDSRLKFHVMDGAAFLDQMHEQQRFFDFIFADTWPGKLTHLEKALALVKPGGLYLIDDMLPQPNWPEGHAQDVATLIKTLETRTDFRLTKMNWSTGHIIAVRIG